MSRSSPSVSLSRAPRRKKPCPAQVLRQQGEHGWLPRVLGGRDQSGGLVEHQIDHGFPRPRPSRPPEKVEVEAHFSSGLRTTLPSTHTRPARISSRISRRDQRPVLANRLSKRSIFALLLSISAILSYLYAAVHRN